jgi:hypothetical protein
VKLERVINITKEGISKNFVFILIGVDEVIITVLQQLVLFEQKEDLEIFYRQNKVIYQQKKN